MTLDTGPRELATLLAAEATTLGDLFRRRVARDGHRTAFFDKLGGTWRPTTWAQWGDRSARFAAGLAALGVQPGDRVAISGPTRPEWAVHEMGAQIAGCISLGIYPRQSVEQIRYLLEHSGAAVITVAEGIELDTILAAAEGIDTLRAIVPWDATLLAGRADPRLTDPAFFTRDPLPADAIDARLAARDADDPAIFVYTSGTTGPPKCAMITHRNILWLLEACAHFIDFYTDDLSLSFLPMPHVAERILAFYGRINAGYATAFATSFSTVLDELGEVRPTIFGSVPRLFEKAYARVQSELERKPPLLRRLFAWADAVGRKRSQHVIAGESVPLALHLQHAIADLIVLSKIRAAFGGRVRYCVTGAAPTPREVLAFFWGAGVPLYEVYGQTEATVVTHGNTPGRTRLGTVGQLIPGLEQKLAPDGELLIRGPAVFAGYHRDPQATAETIRDGWLHTGDVAHIDADGYVSITDRKKHIIITAGGKNLTPANIEKAIKAADTLIGHAHAHADKRSYVSALIVPGPLETLAYGLTRGIVSKAEHDARAAELIADPTARTDALTAAMAPVIALPEFRERIRAAVAAGNARLSHVEQVRRFVILDRDFSQAGGELTPTMKVKRKAVEVAYADVLDRIYAEPGFAMEP